MKLPTRRHLSPSELRVLALVAEGLTDAEIAARLRVSRWTVQTQVRALRHVIGARSRAHAVALGLRAGLIT